VVYEHSVVLIGGCKIHERSERYQNECPGFDIVDQEVYTFGTLIKRRVYPGVMTINGIMYVFGG
jgi:hypothetical protein